MDSSTEAHDPARADLNHSAWLAAQLTELELLYDTAPVGLGLVDNELRFVRINARLAQINGQSVAAHIGQTIRTILPALADVLEPIYRRVLEVGEPVLDVQIHGEAGAVGDWLASYRPVRAPDRRVVGVSVVVQEITELQGARRESEAARLTLERGVAERTAELRAALEQLHSEVAERERVHMELHASQQRYRELVETIHDVVFTVDMQGRLTYLSPAIEALSGYRPEEVVGRSYADLIHPDDLEAARERFRQYLVGDGRPFECRMLTQDGQERWVRTFSRFATAADGSMEFRGVITDITDRRLAEQRSHAQHSEMAHVQRIATVGELTAQVAHEINQPLAAIVNFADGLTLRLRDAIVDPPAMLKVAEQIATEGRRAAEVIRRLRDFARKGAVQAEASDLNGLLQEVVQLCEADAHRHAVAIRLQLDHEVGVIHLDRIQIQQVIMNLLRNALDAVIGPAVRERTVTLTTRGDAPRGVLLSVRDSGVGLPEAAQERIFEAFFTTKRDGLGIGLSISRSIVEAHGGRMWAERNPTCGSTFHVYLPASPV